MREKQKEKTKEIYQKMRKEKGITLIALVITIVILIILATVAISVVFGEGGLIDRAEQGKDLYEQAQTQEQQELLNTEAHLNELLAGTGGSTPEPPKVPETVAEAKNDGTKFEDTTKLKDDSGDDVYIPGGFEVGKDSATDADDGVVITDGTNEFVWIPVADYTTMYQEAPGTKLTGVEVTTDVYSKLRVRSEDDYTAGIPGELRYDIVKEPDLINYYDIEEGHYKKMGYNSATEMAEALVAEYEKTYNSIKKYHGFYIGRYELTGTVEKPTVQRNQTVIIKQSWYNFKKACTNVISSDYAQTTMVYGNQWDEIMSWLIATGDKTEKQVNVDSSDWGNTDGYWGEPAQISGKDEKWKANNIYDLAGYYLEYTQEVIEILYHYNRTYRGINEAANNRFSASAREVATDQRRWCSN